MYQGRGKNNRKSFEIKKSAIFLKSYSVLLVNITNCVLYGTHSYQIPSIRSHT